MLHSQSLEGFKLGLQATVLLIFIVTSLLHISIFIFNISFILEIGPLRFQVLPLVLQIEGKSADGGRNLARLNVLIEDIIDYSILHIWCLDVQLVQAI